MRNRTILRTHGRGDLAGFSENVFMRFAPQQSERESRRERIARAHRIADDGGDSRLLDHIAEAG